MHYIQAWAVGFNEIKHDIIPFEILYKSGQGRTNVTGILSNEVKNDIELCYLSVQYQCSRLKYKVPNYDVHVNFPIRNVSILGSSYRLALVNAFCQMSTLPNKYKASESLLTGDVSLSGDIFSVDGIKQKYDAFKQHDLKNFIIPEEAQFSFSNDHRVIKASYIIELLDISKGDVGL
ncbi:MAG: S16 family serine protease [Oligoflexales bacterium]